MMEITFLGTAAMQPTKKRNHPGFLLSYKKENILFDCGEGIQRQIRIAGKKPAKITRLLISHWHGDHVFGIPGLLSAMGVDKAAHQLQIYGPKGTKKYISYLFKSFSAKEIIPYKVHEVTPGRIIDENDFYVEAQVLKHLIPCLGYSFKEKDRRRIKINKAKKKGLQGPILGKLQQGKSVTWQGKKIKAEEVTYLVKGKKVGYLADTLPCPGAEKLAREADLLVSEGTHLDELQEKTKRYNHLTVKQAAQIAKRNKAKKLIITHISQRYENNKNLLKEAKTYFKNSFIAEDFMEILV